MNIGAEERAEVDALAGTAAHAESGPIAVGVALEAKLRVRPVIPAPDQGIRAFAVVEKLRIMLALDEQRAPPIEHQEGRTRQAAVRDSHKNALIR